jgi:hypothetical protein
MQGAEPGTVGDRAGIFKPGHERLAGGGAPAITVGP